MRFLSIFESFGGCKHPKVVNNRVFHNSAMAKSKYEYVKKFESDENLLPNCWIVVRIDGKGFHRFTETHCYAKPNDLRGLNLMTQAATTVMNEWKDICIAFGHSDEYSFVFRKDTSLFNRRASKLLSIVNSLFASSFVYNWSNFFGPVRLQYPPVFDARIVLYPTDQNLRDYLSWRQADVHINNLYNTVFWLYVMRKGLTHAQAEEKLRGTLASDKNEMLFSEFGLNYNNEPPMYRKGTVLVRKLTSLSGTRKFQQVVLPFHTDIIGEAFWRENAEILGLKPVAVNVNKVDSVNKFDYSGSEEM